MIRFACPSCGSQVSAPNECAGRASRCKCGQPLMVPTLPDDLPLAPAVPEKTVLGQVIAHAPTQLNPALRPMPLSDNMPPVAKGAKPPAGADKTVLGHVTATPKSAHRTTGASAPNEPASGPNSKGVWACSAVLLAFGMLFAFSAIVGLGVFLFVHYAIDSQPSAKQVTKGPDQSAELPRTSTEKKAKDLADKKDIKPADDSGAGVPDDSGAKKDKKIEQKEQPAPKKDDRVEEKKQPDPEDKPDRPRDKVDPKKAGPEDKVPADVAHVNAIKQIGAGAARAKDDVPPAVVRCIDKLKTGTTEEKVQAAEQLATLGKKAKQATTALCEASVSSTKEVSQSALLALEKVAPELHEPVFVLVVDGQAANHLKAIAKLRQQGAKAKPAVPVMLYQVRKCQADLEQRLKSGGAGWGQATLVTVITNYLEALTLIAPEDPETLKTIISVTDFHFAFGGPGAPSKKFRGFEPFKSTGLTLLTDLAKKRPEHREQIVKHLSPMLTVTADRIKASDASDFQAQQELPHNLADLQTICAALFNCGADGKDAVDKTALPLVKDLEFHKDASVRNTAKQLRKTLESGPPGQPRGMELQEVKNMMKQFGLAYHSYVSDHNRGPAKWQDLNSYYGKVGQFDKALQDGWIVFIWNVRPQEMTQGTSNTILAYEKDAGIGGLRVVLFGDGSVDMLPEDEFNKTPKAKQSK